MKRQTISALGIALCAATSTHADDALRREALAAFGRIEAPSAAAIATPEVALGRALFWDTRISLDGKTACASCHPAEDWGADRRPASIDAKGLPTPRQSPTVFNSMGQPSLRWLGDRKSGAEQAEGSMTGSMGFATKQAAVDKLKELQYAEAFVAAYPGESEALSARNYGRALNAYQATLATPSAFDRFLAGDDRAMTPAQEEGLRAFMHTGCASCHRGPLLGGSAFMKFGVVKDYWTETGSKKIDTGRFAMTKKEEDKYVFRVAMLRNVAKTGPWFHDGSAESLERAIQVMGSVQLGRALDAATLASIREFLESLTGEVPAHYAPPGGTAQAGR